MEKTKICTSCTKSAYSSDNFCMNCGQSEFTSPAKQVKIPLYEIKSDEKECPKCKLILKSNDINCSFCGMEFFGSNTSIILGTTIQPNADVIQDNGENAGKKKNSKLFKNIFIITAIIIGIGTGIYEYGKNKLIQDNEINQNIVARQSDSTANALRIELDAKQRQIDSLQNSTLQGTESNSQEKDNAQYFKKSILVIQNYFDDISNDDFDAWEYFGSNIDRYISLRNATPESINESYRNGIEQFQVSHMSAEFGLNPENKIISLRYPKVYDTQYFDSENEIPTPRF